MPERGRPPYPDVLTVREWEVYYLLRKGLTNQEIAEWLGISFHGAKFHVSEVLTKLGVEHREELAELDLLPATVRKRLAGHEVAPVRRAPNLLGHPPLWLAVGGPAIVLFGLLTFVSAFVSAGRFTYLLPVLAAIGWVAVSLVGYAVIRLTQAR